MTVTYFKRYRMELRLDRLTPAARDLDLQALSAAQQGVQLVPWSPKLIGHHAEVKWASFREEIDAHVFPCLASFDGCKQLMREISSRHDFVPEATWLAVRQTDFSPSLQLCGTIQGLKPSVYEGAIQNLGVHPDCRDIGIGGMLLRRALQGFAVVGCRYVQLEVTVQNSAAIRLYERIGFQRVETLFKVAHLQFA